MDTSMREGKSYYYTSKYGTEQPKHESNDKYQDIIMIGYHSKLFRDDVMAKYIDDGKHLIPWMGDEELMIDRYDCRGHLYSQEEFTCSDDNRIKKLTPEEEEIENQCDEERYLGLEKDLTEEEFLEEEERKRFRSQYDPTFSYANVGFQYKEEADIPNPGDEEYDPSACFENEEDEDMQNVLPVANQPEVKSAITTKNKGVTKTKTHYGDKPETFGKYKKPENLDIPEDIDLPDSEKAHSIIEKTALFISKQGTQMEIVLKAKQAGNPQFDFLNFGNWLNPYYRFILKKIRDGSYLPSAPSSAGQQKEGQEKSDSEEHSSDEDSENSDDNEYIHPLLQAHRRPIKTTAKPTPGAASTSQPSSSQPRAQAAETRIPQGHYHSNERNALGAGYQASGVNVAAIYLARKYQNSRQNAASPVCDSAQQGDDDDNWADQLEEDQNYFARDASGFPYVVPVDPTSGQGSLHPSFAMMSFIPPPPPPSKENDSSEPNQAIVSTNYSRNPPASAGYSDAHLTAPPSESSQSSRLMQPQSQQHIVPPPPDLKPVVDKLAEYVSRNGESFEEQIKRKRDPRFEFLNKENIYNPYYLYRKQQKIVEIAKKKEQEKKDKEELASKPLRFALKTKTKSKHVIQKTKAVDVFVDQHDEDHSRGEGGEDFDGYRPNKAKKEKTPMEKAQISMDQAKKMIEQVKQQQKALQESKSVPENDTEAKGNGSIEKEKQIQLERRRKAAAFIGMLKQSNSQDSMSESDYTDESDESDRSDKEESFEESESKTITKRHFQEKVSESEQISKKPKIEGSPEE